MPVKKQSGNLLNAPPKFFLQQLSTKVSPLYQKFIGQSQMKFAISCKMIQRQMGSLN